jgi:hypothetical protein
MSEWNAFQVESDEISESVLKRTNEVNIIYYRCKDLPSYLFLFLAIAKYIVAQEKYNQ